MHNSENFAEHFEESIRTDCIIQIDVDQYHSSKARRNINCLLNFHRSRLFGRNIQENYSQILLYTTYSTYTEIGSRCLQIFSEIDLMPIDLGLSHLESGSALAGCLLNLLPNNKKLLNLLQEIRMNEIETFEKICEDQIQLLNISKELIKLKLIHYDSNKPLTNSNSIKLNTVCLNLTSQHIEIVKIYSRISNKHMRLKEIQLKREHLDNQLSMFAAQDGTIGCIANFTRKVSLLLSVLEERRFNEEYISFRWPCKRICKYLSSSYENSYLYHLEDKLESSSLLDSILIQENEIRDVSQWILHILLEFFLSYLNKLNTTLRLILQIMICIHFNILQYFKLNSNELQNPNDVREIQLFKQIVYNNIVTNAYDVQQCSDISKSDVSNCIQLLEEKLPNLKGLQQSVLDEPLLWNETLESNLNFIRPLPGFTATKKMPETHVFLVCIAMKPELFSVISKEFVNFVLAQYVNITNSMEHTDNSFETEKRTRIKELFQPQVTKQIRGYYSDQNSFVSSAVYLILPNKLNDNFLNENNCSDKEPNPNGLFDEVHTMAVHSNRTLFSIDCSDMTDISYWRSLCGPETNKLPYQRILILLRNAHLINKKMVNDEQLYKLLHNDLHSLRRNILQSSQESLCNNQLGIRFDIIIDFTCCTSEKELTSLYNKLPSWLRTSCLPLFFDYKNVHISNKSWKLQTYEYLYSMEDLDKRKNLIEANWVKMKEQLHTLETIFRQLEKQYNSSIIQTKSIKSQITSTFFLLQTQYYAFVQNIDGKRLSLYDFKFYVWLKRQWIISKHFHKVMNKLCGNISVILSFELVLPAAIIINPKSLFNWIICYNSKNSKQQYRLIASIIKPGDKNLFNNGVIITSIRLLIHKSVRNEINKQLKSNSNKLFRLTEPVHLRITIVPIGTFNNMNVVNAIWIESWPPNNDTVCTDISLVLTSDQDLYNDVSQIYLITDYTV
ncbi:unnamed protein product [Heterobilharzia americana]|nr:unnamed protein product [Heterobilharzia americana]